MIPRGTWNTFFLYSCAKCVNDSGGAIVTCDQSLFPSNDDYGAQRERHLISKIVAQKLIHQTFNSTNQTMFDNSWVETKKLYKLLFLYSIVIQTARFNKEYLI